LLHKATTALITDFVVNPRMVIASSTILGTKVDTRDTSWHLYLSWGATQRKSIELAFVCYRCM